MFTGAELSSEEVPSVSGAEVSSAEVSGGNVSGAEVSGGSVSSLSVSEGASDDTGSGGRVYADVSLPLALLSGKISEHPQASDNVNISAVIFGSFFILLLLSENLSELYFESRLFFIPSAFSPTAENVHIVNRTSVMPLSLIKSGA